uniref:Neprosin PEP catalytic domain-containing protein n=1 Tax=Lotus japonicus TaxID=34305 RepID=I3SNH0_LOTJA|nr:unknown [Lotus japonicus]
MTVSLSQDNITKNWWVIINDINIGYFPAALFSNLNSASLLGWGGRTTTPHGTPSPPMGSGQFPDDHFSDGCYFKRISYQDESSEHYEPDDYLIRTFTDKPNCFGAKYYGHWEQVEYSLIFGGPGGECGN